MDRLPDLPLLLVFAHVVPFRQRAAVALTCRRWAACARWVHAPSAYVCAVCNHGYERDDDDDDEGRKRAQHTANELWAHARHLIVAPAMTKTYLLGERTLSNATPSTAEWQQFFDTLHDEARQCTSSKHSARLPLGHVRTMVEQYGVDPSRNDNAALRHACAVGNVDVVRYLLDDARVDTRYTPRRTGVRGFASELYSPPCGCDRFGLYRILGTVDGFVDADPLIIALRNRHTAVARLLVDDNRVVAAVAGNGYQEAVRLAAGDERLCSLLPALIAHGASASVALYEAATHCNMHALDVLLSSDATAAAVAAVAPAPAPAPEPSSASIGPVFSAQTLSTALYHALFAPPFTTCDDFHFVSPPSTATQPNVFLSTLQQIAVVKRLLRAGAKPWFDVGRVHMGFGSLALVACRHVFCSAVRGDCEWAVRVMLTHCASSRTSRKVKALMACALRAAPNAAMRRLLRDPHVRHTDMDDVAIAMRRCARAPSGVGAVGDADGVVEARWRRQCLPRAAVAPMKARAFRHAARGGSGATMRSGRFRSGR